MSRRCKILGVFCVVICLGLSVYALETIREHAEQTTTGTADGSTHTLLPPADVGGRANEAVPLAPTAKSPGTRLPSHLITLNPHGFDPREVQWQRGPFFLVIDNRSGINDLTVRLERRQGRQLKEVKLKRRKDRSAGVFDLPPGEYVLSEANHREWICHITINPH